MKVQLFIPCYIDQLYPQTGFNTIKLLEKAGCEVDYNPNQTCCGQPAYNSGYWSEATTLAKKFIDDFRSDCPIVAPSGSCTAYIIHHYEKLLKKDEVSAKKFELLKSNIYELSDFLINKLSKTQFGAQFPHIVTYHDSCSALREYGIKDEPRKLLQGVKGLKLIEMDECETCCGFGGTFAVKNKDISVAMAEKKVQNALAVGVEYIVTTEASCLMNINGYINKNKLNVKGIHLVDVLANGW